MLVALAAVHHSNHILAWIGLGLGLGIVTFVFWWYILGLGIGIAHRGYRRTRPQPELRADRSFSRVPGNYPVPTYGARDIDHSLR
jgi:hypothetical protein